MLHLQLLYYCKNVLHRRMLDVCFASGFYLLKKFLTTRRKTLRGSLVNKSRLSIQEIQYFMNTNKANSNSHELIEAFCDPLAHPKVLFNFL